MFHKMVKMKENILPTEEVGKRVVSGEYRGVGVEERVIAY